MAGKASVIFNADTGQYVAAVQGMDAATAKAAQTVADAKNKVLAATNQQVSALKQLGASSEDLARVQTSSSNALATITEKNAQKIIASLDAVLAKQLAVKEASKNLNLDIPQSGHGFSDRMAVSTVVREGEGTTSIRAIESFITMIPGATAAAQVFATAIGAAGVLGIVAELGENGYQAFKNLENATRDASRAAEDLNDKTRVSIDDKEIENQKLQDQIDKLSGHPNNGLATALLEAKKNADELINSLAEAFRREEQLFKLQDRGFAESAMHALLGVGPSGTADQRKQFTADNADLLGQVQQLRDKYDDDLTRATTNDQKKALTDAFNQNVDSLFRPAIASAARDKQGNQDEQKHAADRPDLLTIDGWKKFIEPATDNSLKIKNDDTQLRTLEDALHGSKLDASIYGKQAQVGTLKQGKDETRLDDEAARKAAEAQRQQFQDQADRAKLPIDLNTGLPQDPATPRQMYDLRVGQLNQAQPLNKVEAAKQVAEAYQEWLRSSSEATKQIQEKADRDERKQWDDQLAALKAAGPMNAQAEADYWNLAMLSATTGSANYLEAEKRFNEAIAKVREERDRADEARAKAGLQGANDSARIQEATVALEQQTGQLSKYDAAVQLANIHSQQYAAQMAALKAELAKQQAIDPDSAASVNAQTEIDKAVAGRQVQIQTDAAKAAAEQWKIALEQTNAEWIQNATDSASQVRQLYTQAIDGFNEQAASAMTGGKTNWSGYVRGIGKTVATDGLKRAEAPLLGALGIGKPDGSASNPLYVRMAGGAGNGSEGASSAFSGLMKLFSKGGGGSSDASGGDDSDVGDAVSSIADKALGGFADAVSMGGFALGGDVGPSAQTRSFTAGEMGPERIDLGPGTAAHVTPNKDMGSGSGSAYYHIEVANGVTPEETDMRIRAALSQYHPQGVRSSVQAMQEVQRRKPASAR